MNSRDKQAIITEIDAAIDVMDMSEIERGLTALSAAEASTIEAEDVKLFSTRIKKLNREAHNMNKPRAITRAAIVAAAVMLTGLSVFAAARLNLFSFQQGNRFVLMHTTESITEQQARASIGKNPDAPAPVDAVSPPVIEFDDVEQAQDEMDLIFVLPSTMPDMELSSISGQRFASGYGGENRSVWLIYADGAGRLFSIYTTRIVLPAVDGATFYTTRDIDEGSLDSYISKTGVEYSLLTTSDDTGERTAHLAMAMVGEYEYTLGFFGFDEAERKAVIDSADLSAFNKEVK